MKNYIKVNDKGNTLYFKLPNSLPKHQIANYILKGTKRSPKAYLKGVYDLYGEENIEIVMTDENLPVTPYNKSVKTPQVRTEGYIEHNLITGEHIISYDEDNKLYTNQNCIKDRFVYYSRKVYYEDPTTKENLKRLKETYIKRFLKENINNIAEMLIAENEDGKPYLTLKLINN